MVFFILSDFENQEKNRKKQKIFVFIEFYASLTNKQNPDIRVIYVRYTPIPMFLINILSFCDALHNFKENTIQRKADTPKAKTV